MSDNKPAQEADHRAEQRHGDERSEDDRPIAAPADDPESPGATIDDEVPAEPNEPA